MKQVVAKAKAESKRKGSKALTIQEAKESEKSAKHSSAGRTLGHSQVSWSWVYRKLKRTKKNTKKIKWKSKKKKESC